MISFDKGVSSEINQRWKGATYVSTALLCGHKNNQMSVALYPAVLVLNNKCDFSNLSTSKNLIISNVLYKQ